MMTYPHVSSPWVKLVALLFPSPVSVLGKTNRVPVSVPQMQLGSPHWGNDSRCNRIPAPVSCALAEFQII
jgi:hypothetical protein